MNPSQNIQMLFEDLHSNERSLRENARKQLIAHGPTILDQLTAIATDRRPIVRWEALKILIAIQDSAALPLLTIMLADEKSSIRWAARRQIESLLKQ